MGFGALNLDMIYRVDKIPSADEEGYVKDLKLYPGGSAANTIVALSRLGMGVGYIGKIGNDDRGRILYDDLVREGVSTECVIRSEGRSGAAIVLVDDFGNRAILVDPGVNDTIRYEEIDVDEAKKYRLLHLTSFICKNGFDSFESQKRLAAEFDLVSFDPGMPYAERGIAEMEPILKNTTIFMPNRKEMETMFGTNYREAAEMCLSMGCEVVVVKLGEEGCWIRKGDREVRVKPFSVKVVDTTGAGDAFNAGFLYGYLKGRNIEDCGRMGNYVAAMCIQKVGAREGLPRKIEI